LIIVIFAFAASHWAGDVGNKLFGPGAPTRKHPGLIPLLAFLIITIPFIIIGAFFCPQVAAIALLYLAIFFLVGLAFISKGLTALWVFLLLFLVVVALCNRRDVFC
jgi:hypothetical protein